jgi:predicted RNA binding protein YcfA (HicA-like mRNA interferase family)
MNKRKLLKKALAGGRNLAFRELVALVEAFGFELARTAGSHHIFEHPEIPELVNLQSRKGKTKPYQVKQFLELIEQYNLRLEEDA